MSTDLLTASEENIITAAAPWMANYAELQVIVSSEEIKTTILQTDAELTEGQEKYLRDLGNETIAELLNKFKVKSFPPSNYIAHKMEGHTRHVLLTPVKGGSTKKFTINIRSGFASQTVVKYKRAIFKLWVTIEVSPSQNKYAGLCLERAEESLDAFIQLCFLERLDALDGDGQAAEYIKKFVSEEEDHYHFHMSEIDDQVNEFLQMSTQQEASSNFVKALNNSINWCALRGTLAKAYERTKTI